MTKNQKDFIPDAAGIPTANWGKPEKAPALASDVAKVLGAEQADKVVANGVLDMIAAFNDDQWESLELWEDISGINADTLREGGYEGEILPLTRHTPRP